MTLINQIMENTQAYRLWQSPFATQKFAPILSHNDLAQVQRVLDVGCGPGTNTPYFVNTHYLGIDWNPKYIEFARRRYRRNFVVADITRYTAPPKECSDFILLNSFLHHVDTPNACRILAHLCTLLSEGGHVHILDLVLPVRPSIAKFLARMDRGEFPRPLDEWSEMFQREFEPVVFECYPLKALGATLWNRVYFKGRPKT